MPERADCDVRDHPATLAWGKVDSAAGVPDAIEVLQQKSRSSVYRLVGAGRDGSTVIAKYGRLHKSRRERMLYEEVLPRLPANGPQLLGSWEDERPTEHGPYGWLFLEESRGQTLSQANPVHRELLARWLATFHTAAARIPSTLVQRLPDLGSRKYLSRVRAARQDLTRILDERTFEAGARKALHRIVAVCDAAEAAWGSVERFCDQVPRTINHGDCQPKNLHVVETSEGPALVPLDWGSAGWGFAGADLGHTALPTPAATPKLPDFEAYLDGVQRQWSDLDLATVRRLSQLGKLFISLYIIHAEVPSLGHEAIWIDKYVAKLEVYESWVRDALGSFAPEGRVASRSPRRSLPDQRELANVLSSVLGNGGGATVAVRGRRANEYVSTYLSEAVTVEVDGAPRTVFCKYGVPIDHDSYGHRGDVAYEARVYRRVLDPLRMGTPRYHGSYEDASTGGVWLVIEAIAEHLRLERDDDPDPLTKAARWIGEFHRANECRCSVPELGFLSRHDEAYYRGWARRTSKLAGPLHAEYPWLKDLCDRAPRALAVLLEPPLTVVHGEYYPHNILVRAGKVHPVDWQSTAIGAGELDLAALIDGWDPEFAGPARLGYRKTRWPDGEPDGFDRRTDAALLYLQLRWLGDRPAWTHQPKARARFERARTIATRLELI